MHSSCMLRVHISQKIFESSCKVSRKSGSFLEAWEMVVLKFSTSKMTFKKLYYEYDCSELFNWTTQLSQLCVPRYEQSDDYGRMRYEDDFLAYLQQIMSDVDRRIRRGHSRLALSNAQQNVSFNFHVVLADVAVS